MVDSKFLVVTTLCYVGIFGVIFIVCCCAWARHLRKEGRGYSSRLRNNTNRRLHRPQPPDYPVTTYVTPSTPMYAHRGNEFAEEDFQDGNTYFPAGQRPQHVQRKNLYPVAGHYPMFAYPRVNVLPTSVTTDVEVRHVPIEVNSLTCGETSQCGFSGEDFSDATSSRFDDSAFAESVQEKCHDLTLRTISPSAEGQNDKNEAESDDSSQDGYLKEVTI